MNVFKRVLNSLFGPIERRRDEEVEKYGDAYVFATSLEMAAFKCCNRKMFSYARKRRRKALLDRGITPWF